MPLVLRKDRTKSGNRRYGVSYEVKEAWNPNVDSKELAARVAEIIAKAHQKAIRAGEKADGSGPQKKLQKGAQKALADAGKRPNVRGYDTGKFPDSISASEKAKWQLGFAEQMKTLVTVGVSGPFTTWLAREAERGVEYFYTDGEIAKEVERVVAQWLARAIDPKK